MEIKNSQILLIESSLNELHKIMHEKDSKIVQLQKDKEYLKDTVTNGKYEFESIQEENEKLKKQIKILFEKQNDLKEDIQEKDLEIRTLETNKRQAEKIIQTKNNSLLLSVEEKLFESNEQIKQKDNHIKELKSRNEYLQNIIELHKNEEEILKYDNLNQKKQIKQLRENILEGETKLKRYEYNEMINTTGKNSIPSKFSASNKKLDDFEKKFQDSKKNIEKEEVLMEIDNTNSSLSEEEILKNNLGL